MPTYGFKCHECGYEQDVFMTYEQYQRGKHNIVCPECDNYMKRSFAGQQNAPNIKTVTRMEDVWRKAGLSIPGDPDFNRKSAERIKMLRDKAMKEKEEQMNRAEDLKKKGMTPFKPSNQRGQRIDPKSVPDKASGRVSIDKDGGISSENQK